MRNRWKTFSGQWTRLRHRSTPAAVHEMRSASRRMVSSICVAAWSSDVPAKQATHRLKHVSDQLGPLRDNYVYQKTLERLNCAEHVRPFARFLARRKLHERRRLDKFFGRYRKRAVRRRIDKLERRLRRILRDWTVGDFYIAFEKVLRRQYKALILAHQAWENNPDNKRFHRMRIEVRDLRYASEVVAEVLGLSRTHKVQTSLQLLRSLQTTMGDIHDIHKLRTELVKWIRSRPVRKCKLEISVAAELQKEFECRMVEFKDHTLASEDLLLLLQKPRRQAIRRIAGTNSPS